MRCLFVSRYYWDLHRITWRFFVCQYIFFIWIKCVSTCFLFSSLSYRLTCCDSNGFLYLFVVWNVGAGFGYSLIYTRLIYSLSFVSRKSECDAMVSQFMDLDICVAAISNKEINKKLNKMSTTTFISLRLLLLLSFSIQWNWLRWGFCSPCKRVHYKNSNSD